MKTLPLRFITEDDFISDAIRVVSFSEWSHVEIGPIDLTALALLMNTSFGFDHGYIGAHASGGIQVRPLDYCKPTRERRYELTIEDDQFDLILTSIAKDVGKVGYDVLACFGLFVHNRGLHDASREICSEWVFQKTWDGGVMLLNVLPTYAHLIDPEKLHLSSLLIGRCVVNV